MKVELSKREIEAILEIMGYGWTFLLTHGSTYGEEIKKDNKKEKVNMNELEEKLKEYIK